MKILLIKTSALGDLVHTFPAISYLMQQCPHLELDWVVEKEGSEIVKSHPAVTNTLVIDSKQWRRGKKIADFIHFKKELQKKKYDVVFDLQGNTKSAIITYLAKSHSKVGFGWQTVSEWPNLLCTHHRYNPPVHQNIRNDYLFLVQSFFKDQRPMEDCCKLNASHEIVDQILEKQPPVKKIMVCPGSAWRNKKVPLPALTDFLKLLQEEEKCTYLFAWGSQTEKTEVETLHEAFKESSLIVDKLPLATLQNLMSHMDLVISMDSLPLHLAGSSGVPTFSFFGPSSSFKYRPLGPQHQSFQGTCPYNKQFEKRCPILRTCKTGDCLRKYSGSDLFTAYKHTCQ